MGEPNLAAGDYTRSFSLHGLPAGHYTVTAETQNGLQSRVVLVR